MEHHDVDWASRIDAMLRDADLFADSELEIARWLAGEPASRILDVGCGVGSMALALAIAFPDADVTAADRSPEMLAAARNRLDSVPQGARVEVREIDLEPPLHATARVDLVWASLVVHHLPDQIAGLRRLRQRLAAGGRLALAEGGLPVRSLPWDIGIGRPGLEVRLDAAQNEWFTTMRSDISGSVAAPVGWTAALRSAGFSEVTSRSFLVELPAPLAPVAREAVVDRLRLARERFGAHGQLDPDDVETLDAITDESRDEFVGRRDDLHYLWVRTVHVGRN